VLYLTHSPRPPLDGFIGHFWLLSGAQTSRQERILPSGTIELVVNLREDEMRIHDPAQPGRYERFSGAYCGCLSATRLNTNQSWECTSDRAVRSPSYLWRRARSRMLMPTCTTSGVSRLGSFATGCAK